VCLCSSERQEARWASKSSSSRGVLEPLPLPLPLPVLMPLPLPVLMLMPVSMSMSVSMYVPASVSVPVPMPMYVSAPMPVSVPVYVPASVSVPRSTLPRVPLHLYVLYVEVCVWGGGGPPLHPRFCASISRISLQRFTLSHSHSLTLSQSHALALIPAADNQSLVQSPLES
jgi:hypothetical protein